MRLSSNLFIYSLQVLATTSLVSKAAAFAEDRDPIQFDASQVKGTQVGDVYEVTISSTYDESEIKPVTSVDGKTDIYTLTYADASYISVHFSDFDLPPSCSLDITDDEGKQTHTLTGKGKLDLGTFWAHHIAGDTMKLSLSCYEEEDKEFALFEIDQFAAGFPVNYELDSHPYERHLRSRDDNTPSFLKPIDEQRKLSICGSDDKRNAICYRDSEPTIYNKARAVARLLINGRSACTGWLVSSGSLLFTNEHCIDSLSDVQNTDFEFMGEESNCAIGSSDGSWFSSRNPDGIYDGTALLKESATWDYALIQLSGNPANLYGFLELDNRKASINEEIFIPQHPGGRPKEIGVFDSFHNGNCKVMGYRSGCAPEDMRYSCDTEGGSSGSPVLSRTNNKVVALHHCGGGCNGNLGAPIYKFYSEIEGFLPPTNPTTKSPSAAPTKSPTTVSTKSPTAVSTKSPTAVSTKSPTTSPTKTPTKSPTTSPTKSPTKSPTNSPSASPSSNVGLCNDDPQDQFFFRMKGKNPIYKTCRWLGNRGPSRRRNICRKKTSSYGGFGPPKDVCKDLCGTC